MPLLNIYGQYDHLVPPEACEVLTTKVGSRDTENVCLDTGRPLGIYVSSRFQKETVPKIADWVAGQGRLSHFGGGPQPNCASLPLKERVTTNAGKNRLFQKVM